MRTGEDLPTPHPNRATAGAGSPAGAGAPALRSCCLADVTPEPVTFLWPPYVPLRKLTLLEGDPGQGKSWLTMAVAASGSRGAGLPGLSAFAAFRSLIFTAEDGLADTLRPRLDTFTADPQLVYAHDRTVHLDTTEGLAELEREIIGRQPRLVIIDPIMAYVRSQTDVYRANEVRAVLAPLAKLAGQHGCAIVAVRHINKAKGTPAIYAGQGSIDFTAAARSVLLAGSAPGDTAQHSVLHIKSNLAAPGAGFGYRLEEGRFLWTGETRLTAGDLLSPDPTSEDVSVQDEAEQFLQEILAAGPRPAQEILAEAKRAGIAERTLRRAKTRARVVSRRVVSESEAEWLWSLP